MEEAKITGKIFDKRRTERKQMGKIGGRVKTTTKIYANYITKEEKLEEREDLEK